MRKTTQHNTGVCVCVYASVKGSVRVCVGDSQTSTCACLLERVCVFVCVSVYACVCACVSKSVGTVNRPSVCGCVFVSM